MVARFSIRFCLLFSIVIAVCAMETAVLAQGELSALRAGVRRPAAEPQPEPEPTSDSRNSSNRSKKYSWLSSNDDRDDDDDDDDTISGTLVAMGLAAVGVGATAPYWGPRAVMGDDSLEEGYFARYPYREEDHGYMLTSDSALRERYGWLFRTRAEYGDDFNDYSFIGGQVLVDTASRFGLDTEAFYRREALPSGRHEQFWMGDSNIVFRFAQSPAVQMRTGLGFNWLSDTIGSEFGFNFTYSADIFPLDPLVFSAEIDWGRVGRAAVFHGRVTGGVHWHRLELYLGYDYIDVGPTQLGAMVSGVRLWF